MGFLALSVAGVSSPPSTTSLLSFNVAAVVSAAFSVSSPFSTGFAVSVAAASSPLPFSVAAGFASDSAGFASSAG